MSCRLSGARQELPVDDSYTFVYDKTENGKEDAYHTQTKQTEQSERDVLRKMFSTYHILYFLLPEDTASTVKFINKLIKNNTTPKRNNAS